MSDFTYEIIKNIGVISVSESGWTKEINMISWNNRDPKYDIREWAPDRKKMSKGITLTSDEVQRFFDLYENFLPFGDQTP